MAGGSGRREDPKCYNVDWRWQPAECNVAMGQAVGVIM
jgi:hypothetical protein